MNQQLVKSEEKAVEYIPFGSSDKIRLTVNIIKNIIALPTKSGKTCDDRQAMKFIMLCQAQHLNPFAGDAYLLGYDGKDGPQFSLITAHQAFLKRAEVSKDYDGMESGVIVKDKETGAFEDVEGDFYDNLTKDLVGGWAIVHHKTRKIATKRRVRLSRFSKGYGVWQDDPAGMICKCAEADALRSTFPTMLGGLHTPGEVIEVEAEPASSRTGRLVATVADQVVDNPTGNGGEPDAIETRKLERKTAPEAGKVTDQSKVADGVTGAGFTFSEFQEWADLEFPAIQAGSLASFDDLTNANAKLLVRGMGGMLAGLKAKKEGA